MAKNNKNTLPSVLSDEELIREALKESTPIVESTNSIVAFLLFYNIQPGKLQVKRRLLYSLYTKYTKNTGTENEFYYEAGKYLETKSSNGANYYFINKNSFDIGQRTFELLKKSQDTRTTKSPICHKHFKNFLEGFQLQEGNVWTRLELLYSCYKNWAKERGRKRPFSKEAFNKFIKLYFKKEKLVNNTKYVGLNKQLDYAEKEKDQPKIPNKATSSKTSPESKN